MSHISKKKIKEKALIQLQKRFSASLAKLHTTKQTTQFLDELLTDTERVMLGKRLAAICLLSEGLSAYRIEHVLGISISTALAMRRKYENGAYAFIENVYKHKQSEAFWEDIDKILRCGMPSYSGKNRWKWLNELEEKHH